LHHRRAGQSALPRRHGVLRDARGRRRLLDRLDHLGGQPALQRLRQRRRTDHRERLPAALGSATLRLPRGAGPMIERANPGTLHQPVGCYSQAVRAGDLVVTSGQAALDREGRVVAPGDPAGQTRQTIVNIREALAGHGAGLQDVFRVTVYLTDYAHYPAMDAAFREAFGAHPPARATLLSPLILPELLVEMDAWARLPASAAAQEGT